MAPRTISRPVVVAALSLSASGAAQQSSVLQTPAPIITPTPAPTVTPAPLATPSLTPRPGIDDVPTPVFIPNPRPTPTSARAVPDPTPIALPGATPTSLPTPVATSRPLPTGIDRPPIETVILPQRTAAPWWPWVAGGAALLLVVIGLVGLRRCREDWDEAVVEDEPVSLAPAEPLPVMVADGARLTVALRPIRTGLNLISATAECEVTVTNVGDASAHDVHATLCLMSAHHGQDVELDAFYADTTGRSAIPMFALAPGQERRFRAVTALPHDAIHAIDAGGRPMFVPLLALSVHYRDDAGARRIGQAFALGILQGDGAKLAPLWLDGPSRSYDNVAARPTERPSSVN